MKIFRPNHLKLYVSICKLNYNNKLFLVELPFLKVIYINNNEIHLELNDICKNDVIFKAINACPTQGNICINSLIALRYISLHKKVLNKTTPYHNLFIVRTVPSSHKLNY